MEEETVTCYRCEQSVDTWESVSVRVALVSNHTEESARDYANRWWRAESEDVRNAQIQRMLQNSPRGYDEWKHVCLNCISSCRFCEEPYLIPQASDNTFSGDPTDAHRLARIEWSWCEALCDSCADCAFSCERCGTLRHTDDACSVNNEDELWCSSCRDNYTWYCLRCDSSWSHEHGCVHGIHDYGYKPYPEFRWHSETDGDLDSDYQKMSQTPFLGLELEIETRDGSQQDALSVIEDRLGDVAYCKHDSSIDYGFEIVTHPMTLAAFSHDVDWRFTQELSDIGCRSWNTSTCGIHVHISRSAFVSNRHIAMFQHLIINNEVEMCRLAGRSRSEYAKFDGVRNQIEKRLKRVPGYYAGRYEAVNTLPNETLEVRIFRGSLKAARVRMALQLVDAAYHYTKNMSVRNYRDTDRGHFWFFARWCADQERYADLNHYINYYNLTNNLPASLVEQVREMETN